MKDNKFIKEYFDKEYNKENNLKAILLEVKNKQAIGKNKILKMVATFVIAIGLTASVVCAGTIVYEKVFKKPQKIENFIKELEVTQEDLKTIISESEAIEKAKESIKRYGITINDEEIINIEKLKNPNYDEISYTIKTKDMLQVNINATTGKLKGFWREEQYSAKELEEFTTTKNNIIEVAKSKLKEYGFSDEYELSYISSNNQDDEEKSYFWYLWFSKKYDGLFNIEESVSMTIIPQINFVKSLSVTEEPFENNTIIIKEQQAIKIAKEKDNQINKEGYKTRTIKSELAIKPITPDVYLKENGLSYGNESKILEDGTIYNYNTYKMNGKMRKVYVIEISYENRPFGQTRKYYIDATTGEVIGGEDIFDLLELKTMDGH